MVMLGSSRKRRTFGGLVVGVCAMVALVVSLGAGAGTTAAVAAPQNTSPPTIAGTAQEGQKLVGSRGTWSGSPTDYNDYWQRCNSNGDSCANISGANAAAGYTLQAADVGRTMRFKVEAKNADGSTFASSVPTAVIKAAPPKNTSPPTVSGTAKEGQKLVGRRGSWSGRVSDYNDQWVRCDKDGGGCADIDGATNRNGYVLKGVDVGNTIRFKVEARNAGGNTFASSVPTAVVTAATVTPPPVTNGCSKTGGTVPVAGITSPARLNIDQTQVSPSRISFNTRSLTARFHISACKGNVEGALVYVTAVPYGMFADAAEQPSGSDGWATLQFTALAGFPVSQKQQLLVMFVRARKSGEDLLGGISSRRLVSFPVTRG